MTAIKFNTHFLEIDRYLIIIPSHSWNRKLYCVHSDVGLIPILILLKWYERNDIKFIIKIFGEYLKDIRWAHKLSYNVARVILKLNSLEKRFIANVNRSLLIIYDAWWMKMAKEDEHGTWTISEWRKQTKLVSQKFTYLIEPCFKMIQQRCQKLCPCWMLCSYFGTKERRLLWINGNLLISNNPMYIVNYSPRSTRK